MNVWNGLSNSSRKYLVCASSTNDFTFGQSELNGYDRLGFTIQTLITRQFIASSASAPSLRKSLLVKWYRPATCETPTTSRAARVVDCAAYVEVVNVIAARMKSRIGS